mmetsp:Transcript_47272/g.109711  ORF Transcript_47272/g.109711 Transcript_47272/m.109711 type:complete len:328 (+) Transcript_47272:71-1054(+)
MCQHTLRTRLSPAQPTPMYAVQASLAPSRVHPGVRVNYAGLDHARREALAPVLVCRVQTAVGQRVAPPHQKCRALPPWPLAFRRAPSARARNAEHAPRCPSGPGQSGKGLGRRGSLDARHRVSRQSLSRRCWARSSSNRTPPRRCPTRASAPQAPVRVGRAHHGRPHEPTTLATARAARSAPRTRCAAHRRRRRRESGRGGRMGWRARPCMHAAAPATCCTLPQRERPRGGLAGRPRGASHTCRDPMRSAARPASATDAPTKHQPPRALGAGPRTAAAPAQARRFDGSSHQRAAQSTQAARAAPSKAARGPAGACPGSRAPSRPLVL